MSLPMIMLGMPMLTADESFSSSMVIPAEAAATPVTFSISPILLTCIGVEKLIDDDEASETVTLSA